MKSYLGKSELVGQVSDKSHLSFPTSSEQLESRQQSVGFRDVHWRAELWDADLE